MGETSAIQTQFLGGEWSLAAQGRMDDQRYRTALNVCFNGIPIESGAWVRRPGSLFAGQTWLNKPARVYTLTFADAANYTIELTDNSMRFRQGTILKRTGTDIGIASISSASPAVLTTTGAHGRTGVINAVLLNLGTGFPTLQNRQFQATVTGSTTFTLTDLLGNPVSGAGLPAIPAGALIGQVFITTTPWISGGAIPGTGDWNNLRVVQADTVNSQGTEALYAIMLTGAAPQSMTFVPPTPGVFAKFSSLSAISFQDGPYLDIPTDNTLLTPSGLSGSITITLSAGGAGTTTKFTPTTDIGRLVRIYSIPPVWANGTTYSNGSVVFYAGNVYQFLNPSGGTTNSGAPVNGPAQYFPSATPPGFYGWQLQPAALLWSWGTITAVASSTVATLTINGPALIYTNATPYFRLGAYSLTTGFPTCGTFHEGRLWLSGAIPNRVDGSMTIVPTPDATYGAQVGASSPAIFCFCPTDIFGNVSAANGIAASLLSPESNQIFWMEPDQQGIICGTKHAEWLIQATSANLPLTPTSIQAHRYTHIGCANIEPRRCGLTLAFVQFFARKIMEYFSDVFSGRMTGPNLSEMAKHLTVAFVQEIAYQRETVPIIWARDGLGNLLSCTYKRESLYSREKPTFSGWARHQLGSGRTVTSIAMGSNAAGTLDALTMVTTDGSGNYWVEVLSDIPDETATDGFQYVDAAVPVSYIIGTSSLTINGLWHLNGKTVTVWLAGLDVGDYAVSNGAITVTYGDGISAGPGTYSSTTGTQNPGGGAYLLTAAYVTTAAIAPTFLIAVGFTYASQGQVVRPASPADSGARAGPGFGKKRRSHQYAAQVVNTQGLQFGTDFTDMKPALFSDKGDNQLAPNVLKSGVHWNVLQDDWSRDGMLAWQATRPYPVTIAAVGWFVETSDQ